MVHQRPFKFKSVVKHKNFLVDIKLAQFLRVKNVVSVQVLFVERMAMGFWKLVPFKSECQLAHTHIPDIWSGLIILTFSSARLRWLSCTLQYLKVYILWSRHVTVSQTAGFKSSGFIFWQKITFSMLRSHGISHVTEVINRLMIRLWSFTADLKSLHSAKKNYRL